MFCPNCGKYRGEHDQFCKHCGENVSDESELIIATDKPSQSKNEQVKVTDSKEESKLHMHKSPFNGGSKVTIIFLSIVGGLIGIFVVYSIVLNPVEQIAWKLFWAGLEYQFINLDENTVNEVLKSSTFRKVLIGFIIGGITGMILGGAINKRDN